MADVRMWGEAWMVVSREGREGRAGSTFRLYGQSVTTVLRTVYDYIRKDIQ